MASSDRNRRRGDDGLTPDRRRGDRDADKEKDKDQEQEQQQNLEENQQQTRDAAQDQLGNQGVAEMLGMATARPGEAGFAGDGRERRETRTELEFGGDDAPVDGPLTLDDLVRSWNPTTRRTQDATARSGPLADLPPEDEDLLHDIRTDRSPLAAPPAWGARALAATGAFPDALLQPPPTAIVADLRPLVRQAGRWAPPSRPSATRGLGHRAWQHALSPPAPALVDAEGRVVHSRARASALAVLLLVDGLAAVGLDGASMSPLVGFTVDLAGRSRRIDEAIERVRAAEIRLPVAAQVLEGMLADAGHVEHGASSRTPAPDPAAEPHLRAVLDDLLDLPSPAALVPSLSDAEPSATDGEDEDPLDVDGVIAGVVGAADPLAGVYDAALQGAERLAGACARTRIHAAGALCGVADACGPWSAGAPVDGLLDAAAALDDDVGKVLKLLVEIGRAAQSRSVAPSGIRNGLRRAVKGLDTAVTTLVTAVLPLVAAVLPPSRGAVPPPCPDGGPDPLSEAWDDRDPSMALPWLASRAPSLDRDVSVAFTRAAVGPTGVADEMRALRAQAVEAERPALAGALGIAAGAAALRVRAYTQARDDAMVELGAALDRRNGLWLAAAALIAVEAERGLGRPDEADALLRLAGRHCWQLGARAALSLILRWRPPPDPDVDEIDEAFVYGYDEPEAAEA